MAEELTKKGWQMAIDQSSQAPASITSLLEETIDQVLMSTALISALGDLNDCPVLSTEANYHNAH